MLAATAFNSTLIRTFRTSCLWAVVILEIGSRALFVIRFPFCHVAIVLFSFFAGTSCYGQDQPVDQPDGYFIDGVQQSFGLLDEIKMEARFIPEGTYLTPLSLLRAFEDERVFSDLEVVDFQREDFAIAIQRIETAIEKYEKVKKEEGISDAAEKKIFQGAVRKGEESVKAILLPHQIDRVKQVLNQYEVKRVGLAGAICFGNLSRQIELSNADKKQIQAGSIEFYESQIAKIEKHKQSSLSRIRSILSASQEDKLKQFLGEQITPAPLFLTIERAQKDFWSDRSNLQEELPESYKKWLPLAMNDGFQIDEIGAFVDRPQPSDIQWEIYASLMLLFEDPAFVSKLEMSKQQVAVFRQMQAAQDAVGDDWRASAVNVEPAEKESHRQKWMQIGSELRDQQMAEIERVLKTKQKELMKRLVLTDEVRKIGIELSLVHGQLGDELLIKESQKRRIEDQMRLFSKTSRQLLVDLERDATQNTKNQLSEKQIQALDALLGEDLSLSAGLVEFHSALLAGDLGRNAIRHLTDDSNRAFFSYLVKLK